MNSQLWWYLARATGIVAWLLLTASVLWGIFLSTKLLQGLRRPAWLLDLHRWLGALTVSFVALHVAALVADSYLSFGIADVAVPFASDWRPGAVALGVVAMWILAAVELSSLLMRRLSRKAWRGIHVLSYAAFWLTSLHAAFAGSDASSPLYLATSVLSIVLVVFALAYRVLAGRGRGSAQRATPVASSRNSTTRRAHASGSVRRPPV